MRIEKIDGSKVTLGFSFSTDKDKDEIKSIEFDGKLTIDIAEVFNELLKRDLPDFLKKLLKIQ